MKKFYVNCNSPQRKFVWPGKMMKIFVLALVAACLSFSGRVMAQSQRVTLDLKSCSIIEFFRTLQEKTSLYFIYNIKDLQGLDKISVKADNEPVEEILRRIFAGRKLDFNFDNNTVVVQPRQMQNCRIKGRITDTHKNPLPGVTIMIKGTTLGAVTDMDGNYSMELPAVKDIRLLYSFIGMKTQEVAYAGQKEINVTLHEEVAEMEEVVITGYQTVDRRKSTSSVTTRKMEDLHIPGISSLDQMLQGQIPDLIMMSNSGEVGVVPKLRIRGTSTLIGNREPLWVLDGIIMQDPVDVLAADLNDPDYINRVGNAIAGINPQDIERIDVLKDAAATALYGTRAANGVIVVTTKKGRVGRPIVSYNLSTTFRQRPAYSDRAINVMNSAERIRFSRDLVAQHYQFPTDMNLVGYEGLLTKLYNHELSDEQFAREVEQLETLNTDWFDLLTQNTVSHSHTVSISGGSSEANYYASIGYTRDNDVIWDDNNERYTAALNLNTNLTHWMRASLSVKGNVSSRRYYQQDLSPMQYAYNTTRALPAFDENGEYFYFLKRKPGGMEPQYFNYNILNELENSSYDQRGSGLSITANLQFNLTSWLNASAIASYQVSNTVQEGWWGEKTNYAAELRGTEYGVLPAPRTEGEKDYLGNPTYTGGTSLLPYGGELTYNESDNNAYTVRLQLDGNHSFGELKQHNISGTIGFEMSSARSRGYARTDRGYYRDRGMSFVKDVDPTKFPDYAKWVLQNPAQLTDGKSNTVSSYVSVSYSYYNYFTLNANARVDGSNAFGDRSNDKLLPIWSASANWNVSELSGIREVDWLDFFRLKASFGYQGNMLSSESPVMIISKEPLNSHFGENTASVTRYPNPNLKWETTTSYNLGTELGLFQRKVMVEAEYWWKHTEDAFMDKLVASMNGLPTDSYKINRGDIDNHGYNVSLTFLPLQTKDWFWSVSTSVSKTFNKMKNKPDANQYELSDFLNGSALVEGKPIGTFYSYKFVGLSPVNGGPMFDDYMDNPEALYGLSKYDTYTRVLEASGRREPTISGNVSTTLRWRNVRLSGNFAYSLGNKIRLFAIYNGSAATVMDAQNIRPENNVSKDFLYRWQKPGDERRTDIPAIIGKGDDNYPLYERHWSDSKQGIQPIAVSPWDMYDYGNHRVVSGNYLKCSNLSLTYEFKEEVLKRLRLSRLDLTLSATNLFTVSAKELKGQTPTQGGFAAIQLSDRPTYTFGLTVSF